MSCIAEDLPVPLSRPVVREFDEAPESFPSSIVRRGEPAEGMLAFRLSPPSFGDHI